MTNWKPELSLKLSYKQYLPKWFMPTLLGAWVSPFMINWINKTYDGDLYNVLRRLKSPPEKLTFAKVMQEAFNEKWLNWKFINIGQLHYYEEIKENNTWKLLFLKFNLSYFRGSNNYRRYLVLLAIIEYFIKKYNKGKTRVTFYVFNEKSKEKTTFFNKWSSKYESYYAEVQLNSFLGCVAIINKLISLAKATN